MITKIEQQQKIFAIPINTEEFKYYNNAEPNVKELVTLVVLTVNKQKLNTPLRGLYAKLYKYGDKWCFPIMKEFMEAYGLSKGDTLNVQIHKIEKVKR